MAGYDLGIATGVLATFLGADPITVGGTPEQTKLWMSRIANEGLLVAYGATEPQAGSDLAQLKTKAVPVIEDGKVKGYKISGRKQWISNGGVAEIYTILALAPGGPSWFVVEKNAEGFTKNKPKISTASAPPIPPLSSWKTSTWTPTACLAWSKARVSPRRRPSLVIPASWLPPLVSAPVGQH